MSITVGGIGLFLLGMILMTDGLKALAGDTLRRLLERFTGRTLSAVATGAGVTLLVQSSSATTLATVGFVSAGLLGFQNSIGVIIGANLGTTSTGWIVSLLGVKFSMSTVALPLVGIGAVTRLLARGRVAELGGVVAGFGLIFVGIDMLQAGMSGLAARFSFARYEASGVGPRLVLVGIGVAMTIVMQSSSAAVATTLTAVASDAIGLEQAAALIIGQNIGTTTTAIVAAVGASVPAKRTALVHVLFNVVTGLIAFVFLPWFVSGLRWLTGNSGTGADHAVTGAAFHTGFSVLGAALFLPLVPRFAGFISRVIPERRSELTRHLDPSLREVPALAVAASVTTLRGVLAQSFGMIGADLTSKAPVTADQFERWDEAAKAAGALLRRLPSNDPATTERLADTLHLLDHVREFVHDASRPPRHPALSAMPEQEAYARELGQALIDSASSLTAGAPVAVDRIPPLLPETSSDLRAGILASSAAGLIEMDEALSALTAQRWLQRLSHHARRALYYIHRLDDPRSSTDDTEEHHDADS